jgi:hypothetical protein
MPVSWLSMNASAVLFFCHPERGCRVEGPPRSDSGANAPRERSALLLFFVILKQAQRC